MLQRVMISLLLFWVGLPTGARAEDIQQSTLLLQRIQFSEGRGNLAGESGIPFTIATPVLHTSFRTSSYAPPVASTRLKDLVPDSENPRMRGLIAASSWLKGQFVTEGEVANNSSHELPVESRVDRTEDSSKRMVRFALTGSNSQFRYGVNYRSAGRAFFNSPDQTVREMWGEVNWGVAKLRSSVGEMWNNVDLDPTQARIEQRYSRIGLAVGKPSWPEFSLTYARSAMNSAFEPAGFIPQRSQSNSVEGALAYSGLTWNARLASSYILGTDGLLSGADTTAFAQSLSGLYRPFNTLTICRCSGIDPNTSSGLEHALKHRWRLFHSFTNKVSASSSVPWVAIPAADLPIASLTQRVLSAGECSPSILIRSMAGLRCCLSKPPITTPQIVWLPHWIRKIFPVLCVSSSHPSNGLSRNR